MPAILFSLNLLPHYLYFSLCLWKQPELSSSSCFLEDFFLVFVFLSFKPNPLWNLVLHLVVLFGNYAFLSSTLFYVYIFSIKEKTTFLSLQGRTVFLIHTVCECMCVGGCVCVRSKRSYIITLAIFQLFIL